MRHARPILLILLACSAHVAQAASIDGGLIDEPVELHGGGSVRLGDLVGERPIYVKFWASWCVPCREQMPHLEETYREYRDNIEVVSVNIWVNESGDAITSTRDEFGLTVPIAIDERGNLARAFDFFGTPYHVLIDADGDIVHTGHEADPELDRKIELLAARETDDLPEISLSVKGDATVDIAAVDAGVTALFFTATWCDWYLEESRPSMSKACTDAQRTMNRVGRMLPDANLLGVASPLWTTEKELAEYVGKYQITHPFSIDRTNDAFFALNVKSVPTLVVMKDGREVSRISDFRSAHEIADTIRRAAE